MNSDGFNWNALEYEIVDHKTQLQPVTVSSNKPLDSFLRKKPNDEILENYAYRMHRHACKKSFVTTAQRSLANVERAGKPTYSMVYRLTDVSCWTTFKRAIFVDSKCWLAVYLPLGMAILYEECNFECGRDQIHYAFGLIGHARRMVSTLAVGVCSFCEFPLCGHFFWYAMLRSTGEFSVEKSLCLISHERQCACLIWWFCLEILQCFFYQRWYAR